MYASHWKKKMTRINTAGRLSFRLNLNRCLRIFGTVKTVNPIIAANPTHQTAGLPSIVIIDVVPLGRDANSAKYGTRVAALKGSNKRGQVYHGDSQPFLDFKVDW